MATKLSRRFVSFLPARPLLSALLWLGVFVLAACDAKLPTDLSSNEKKRPRVPATTTDTTAPAPAPTPTPTPAVANPLAGAALYVEASNRALTTANEWRATRPADAALLDGIGHTAQAVWFNGWQSDVTSAANTYVSAAAAIGAMPVLVAYNIPQRDCGSYSAGGSSSEDAYRSFIRGMAAGIGSRAAVVILEPDALAGMGCLSVTDRERRTRLLSDAVNILKANARTYVYIDAGHPRWISATEMANRLKAANIAAANGFSLNVSNFIWNSENVTYGQALSALVGNKHFVIDTSRNGEGPTATNEWCNPSGRGLGVAPTTNSGNALVDALLWIKRPGESDGACNGGPNAGAWWPDYALGLAQRATTVVALN